MIAKKSLPNAIALLATGLLAGTFFYAKFNILPTFWEVPIDVHLRFRVALMHHNGVVVQSLMAIAILSSIWFAWSLRHKRNLCFFANLAVLFTIASFLITRFGNVPINSQIKMWSPTAPPSDWIVILKTWDFYHTCRTFAAIASFVVITISTFLKK